MDAIDQTHPDAVSQGLIDDDERPVGGHARRRRRKPVKRMFVVTHRWASLVLGIGLLVITTSGAILLYDGEIVRLLNHEAYAASDAPATTSMGNAQQTVAAAHPDFKPYSVIAEHGVYSVTDFETAYNVDPATGQILGQVSAAPTWLAFTQNLHFCLLSCEGEPGYVAALAHEVPGTSWLGFDDVPITVGGLVLGGFGLVLVFLCVSGLWLWFPRPSRWRSAVTVRWDKGRFARDTDLHKVVGVASLAGLLVWGVTGAGFEMEPVQNAWYATTPGTPVTPPNAKSQPGEGPDIGVDQAVSQALAKVPNSTAVGVDIPGKRATKGVYTVWLANGIDPYAHGSYPGNVGVAVDRRLGVAAVNYGSPEQAVAQSIWESWNYSVHAGIVVNGWWRILWLLAGLAPLALAATGTSTWLIRRRTAKRRKLAQTAVT